MAGNAIVEFLLKWSEQGGQLPEKVKRDLDQMSRGGQQARSVVEELGAAFQRVEKNEPTLAVRRVRAAVEELAASAAGATGPMGRLIGTLGALGGGGALTLGVIAGIAGIAVEVKSLTDLAGKLEEAMTKASDAIAGLGGPQATRLVQLRQLREQASNAQDPGFWTKLADILLLPVGLGDVTSARRTSRASQAASATTGANILEGQITGTRSGDTQRAGEKWAKDFIAGVDAEIHASLQDSRHILWALTHPAEAADLRFAGGMALFSPRPISQLLPTPGRPPFRPRDVFGEYQGYSGFQGLAPDVNTLGMSLEDIGNAGAGARGISSRELMALMSATFGAIGSTASGGLPGLLSGAGGLSTAAAALKGAPAFLGPLGVGLSGIGLLTSLFHHHHVTVDRYGEEAVRQMREVLGLPQALSYVIANANNDPGLRDTAAGLARQQSRGAVTRIFGP